MTNASQPLNHADGNIFEAGASGIIVGGACYYVLGLSNPLLIATITGVGALTSYCRRWMFPCLYPRQVAAISLSSEEEPQSSSSTQADLSSRENDIRQVLPESMQDNSSQSSALLSGDLLSEDIEYDEKHFFNPNLSSSNPIFTSPNAQPKTDEMLRPSLNCSREASSNASNISTRLDTISQDLSPEKARDVLLNSLIEQKKEKHFELFRRLKKENIDYAVKCLKETHEPTAEEIEALKSCRWDHFVFKTTNWVHKAFWAFLIDEIPQQTLHKLFLYDECQKQMFFDFRVRTTNCLKFHLLDSAEGQQVLRESVRSFLNEDEFELLLTNLSKLPKREREFFTIFRPRRDDFFLKMLTSFTPKNLFYIQDSVSQLIPSPQLAYEIYRARFGDQAMKPLEAFGCFANKEKLSDPFQRVLTLPCPYYPVPGLDPTDRVMNADGCPTTKLSFYHHDLYHLSRDSANSDREIWIGMAKFLQTPTVNLSSKQKLNVLLLDRDFAAYLNRNSSFPYITGVVPPQFWIALSGVFSELAVGNKSLEVSLPDFLSFVMEWKLQLPEETQKNLDALFETTLKWLESESDPDFQEEYRPIKFVMEALEKRLKDPDYCLPEDFQEELIDINE